MLIRSGYLITKQRVIRRMTMAILELKSPYCSISEAEKSLRGAIECLNSIR